MGPKANVTEYKGAYYDVPSVKAASLVEVQVVWQINGERLHRIVQPTHTR
jgi:hypothetical protein